MQIYSINSISFKSQNAGNSENNNFSSIFKRGDFDTVEIQKPQSDPIGKLALQALKAEARSIEKEINSILTAANKIQAEEYDLKADAHFKKETAQALAENIRPIYDEISEIHHHALKHGLRTEFNNKNDELWYKREFEIKDGVVRICEYDDDDDLTREAIIDKISVQISLINENTNKWDVYTFDKNSSRLLKCAIGHTESSNGSYSAQEQYVYNDKEEIASYEKKPKLYKDGTQKAQERFDYQNGELTMCSENYISKPSGYFKADEKFELVNGRILYYYDGLEEQDDEWYSAYREFRFNTDDELCACAREIKVKDDMEIKRAFSFKNGEICQTNVDFKYDFADMATKSAKTFSFKDGKAYLCELNCQGIGESDFKIDELNSQKKVTLN